jgi:hypothetical protein
MTQSTDLINSTTATVSAEPALQPRFIKPDLYELTGNGITVSYLPTGAGGLAHFSYQDSQRTLHFIGAQIRRVQVPDLGAVVSVTLVMTVDSGSITFSVLIPDVNLPDQRGASAPIQTEGITTTHRFSIVPIFNQGQRELYSVTPLSGSALAVIIPL